MHHHVTRQILVHIPEPVTQPRTHTRTTRNLASCLNVGNRRIVIDGLGKGRVHHAEILHHLRSMRKKFTYPDSVLIILLPREFVFRRTHRESILTRGHPRDTLTIANILRKILPEHLLHLRLVIPHVMLTRTAAHEEVNHPLGGRLVMHPLICRGRLKTRPHQLRQRGCSQPQGRPSKELAAGLTQTILLKNSKFAHHI